MKIRLKYVQHWVDKKTGGTYCFLRRPGHDRVRLPGVIGSAEFMAGYYAAIKGEEPGAAVAAAQKISSLIEGAIKRYIADELPTRVKSDSTRARQASTLNTFAKKYGTSSVTAINVDFVNKQIRQAPSPIVGRTWLITVREFCKWAVEENLIDADPTAGIVIKLPKSDGHYTWEEEDIAQFEARWPHGTIERLLFSLLLYTGQRCSDVLKLGPARVINGTFKVKQIKTGAEVVVKLHDELLAAIAAYKVVGIKAPTYLHAPKGGRMDQRNLNELFRDACTAAGLDDKFVPHGLRKAFCRRLADQGLDPWTIASLSGHMTIKEVERYCKAYNRRKAAERGMDVLNAAYPARAA